MPAQCAGTPQLLLVLALTAQLRLWPPAGQLLAFPPGWVDLVQTRPRQHVARVLQAGGNSSARVHVHMCLRPAVNTHPVADGQCGYTAHVQC